MTESHIIHAIWNTLIGSTCVRRTTNGHYLGLLRIAFGDLCYILVRNYI